VGSSSYPYPAVRLVGKDNDPINLNHTSGSLDVFLQDQFTTLIDLYVHQNIADLAISSNTSIDDTVIAIDSGHGVTSLDMVCIIEEGRYYQGIALTVSATAVGLDTPLDFAYTTAAGIHSAEHDLSVNGSGNPQIYHITPPSGTQWDVTRMLFHIEGTAAMDTSKFGDISALTNGLVVRATDGQTQNIFNVKTNGEFAERAYDITYDSKAPAGSTAFRCRRSFGGQDKNGVVVRLTGATSDQLQVIVQDNCSSLEHMHVIAQGHVVEG
jgi:hypothetical protein